LIPLSLYIHLPWCVRKCPYCDFNSHASPDVIPEDRYVAALLRDLETELPDIWGRRIQSIFIGGGTPSLFSAAAMDQLLSGVRALLPITADCEITLEANPGTVEQANFRGYRESGINRLSLGIQSFDDGALRRLGRIHSSDEAHRAIETAQQCGFDNFNLDLMFGLPGHGVKEGINDLEQAIAHAPAHLSWYQLTLEPNTLFYNQPPELPASEVIETLFDSGQEALAEAGFGQYEVSAYARAGRQCLHNLNYWEFGDYLGIGAGAHGKLTSPADFTIRRTSRHRQPEQYMQAAEAGQPVSNTLMVDEDQRIFEFMLNALRLKDGFDQALFEERTGLPWSEAADTISKLRGEGLLSCEGRHIKPSRRGWLFIDEMTAQFLPDHD
jgi:putative oxygen-independent coproporphyrinogen III oxidase